MHFPSRICSNISLLFLLVLAALTHAAPTPTPGKGPNDDVPAKEPTISYRRIYDVKLGLSGIDGDHLLDSDKERDTRVRNILKDCKCKLDRQLEGVFTKLCGELNFEGVCVQKLDYKVTIQNEAPRLKIDTYTDDSNRIQILDDDYGSIPVDSIGGGSDGGAGKAIPQASAKRKPVYDAPNPTENTHATAESAPADNSRIMEASRTRGQDDSDVCPTKKPRKSGDF